MRKDLSAIIIVILTFIAFFLTTYPATSGITNDLFLLYIAIVFFGSLYYPIVRRSNVNARINKLYLGTIFVAILFWVGVTGWFFSPFFYLLYLLAIILAFIISPFATSLFVISLVGLFAPNIGSIDLTLDFVTILSLLSVVPITYFLQKEYLYLRQQQKKVLILEEETKDLKNKVDEVLRNRVIKFAVTVRQPVNDIKQLAMFAQHENKEGIQKLLRKIVKLGDQSLKTIEQFEVTVTGQKLIHTATKNLKNKK